MNPRARQVDAFVVSPQVRLIDVRQAAGMYSVAWRTFLRWADAGLVPWGLKISGRRLWRIDELENHIREGCRPVKKGGAK
jgi:hypothetical protein